MDRGDSIAGPVCWADSVAAILLAEISDVASPPAPGLKSRSAKTFPLPRCRSSPQSANRSTRSCGHATLILAQRELSGRYSFAYLQQLRQRDSRERSQQFLIEGVRFVSSAEQYGAQIDALFYAGGMLNSPAGWKQIERFRTTGRQILELTADEFRSLSLLELPQGIGAVVRIRYSPLAAVPARDSVWLSLDTIRSPGNLGTMLRTSAAAGAAGCLLCGSAVDPFDPRTVRATMGTLFTQRLVRTELPELAAWSDRHGVRLVGTSPDARLDYRAPSYRGSVVLLIGGERRRLRSWKSQGCR